MNAGATRHSDQAIALIGIFPPHMMLCGLPGSGKTTVGQTLSAQTGLPFYDLDELVVRQEQKDIPAIFSEQGEAVFRLAEKKALQHFLEHHSQDRYILALGGGTPCFHQNLELVLQNGTLVYLEIPAQAAAKRLEKQAGQRPLLSHNAAATLEHLLAVRAPFYRQAQLTVNALDDAATVAENIRQLLR